MPAWTQLPNLFTILRFLLTPLTAWAIWTGRPALALAVFGAAALTDYLDGAAARRFQLASRVGAVLDPLADKFLLSGVFLMLTLVGSIPWWLLVIVFGRDLFILLGAGCLYYLASIRDFPPSIWGKVSTCVQIGTVIAWLVYGFWNFRLVEWLAQAGLWICATFTVWSGFHYAWRALHTVRTVGLRDH